MTWAMMFLHALKKFISFTQSVSSSTRNTNNQIMHQGSQHAIDPWMDLTNFDWTSTLHNPSTSMPHYLNKQGIPSINRPRNQEITYQVQRYHWHGTDQLGQNHGRTRQPGKQSTSIGRNRAGWCRLDTNDQDPLPPLFWRASEPVNV
jgi:hypothetical protein